MNKYKYIIGITLLMVGVVPTFAQISNDKENRVNKIDIHWAKNDFVPGQVLVKFKDANRIQVRRAQGKLSLSDERGVISDKLTSILQKYGANEMEKLLPNENPNRKLRRARAFNGEMIQERDLSQLYCLKLSVEHHHETMQLADELNALDEVEYAELDYYCYITGGETIAESYGANPMVRQQWYLDTYGVTELWYKPIINAERPVIAIIDTGVDTKHPDLKDNCIEGYDFVNNTSKVIDDNMHGTHVAGIAAACNNGTGIVGANPRALVMPIKVLDKSGRGNTATILQGVQYAVDHEAKIINLSLGGYSYSKAATDVYRNASLNAIIVAAAGNDGKCIYASHTGTLKHGIQPAPCFPAAYSFVLGVQATNRKGELASFSNYDDDGPLFSCESSLQEPDGFNYEMKAPGTEILSTLPGGGYGQLQGTSMASPLVAGAISALMMVKNYDSQEQLWAELLHTNNIAEAYELTELPADLEVVRIMLRERKEFSDETDEAYTGRHIVNAGETIDIYPVIRCVAGEANNIKVKLDYEDNEEPDVVQIITEEIDFGLHLDAMGKAVSQNPIIVKIPEDIVDGRRIRMKVVVSCDNQEGTNNRSFTLIANNKETISGRLTEDVTLKSGHAYFANSITINEGVTLTIEPGTRLEFANNAELISNGKLIAKGTPIKPIVMTNHDANYTWKGISVKPKGQHTYYELYMNNDSTLFTLVQTEATPKKIKEFSKTLYYSPEEGHPEIPQFNLNDYMGWKSLWEDLTGKEEYFTDPNFITPAVLAMLKDWRNFYSQYSTKSGDGRNLWFVVTASAPSWKTYDEPIDTIEYCRFEGCRMECDWNSFTYPYMIDCIISGGSYRQAFHAIPGIRNVLTENFGYPSALTMEKGKRKHWNIINNSHSVYNGSNNIPPSYSDLIESNYFNNPAISTSGKEYWLQTYTTVPIIDHANFPSYLGTSREDIVRLHIYESGNASNEIYGSIDLNNMRKEPVSEAHGIVWKVVVNDKDAQDEYEDLAPLGVGKHKFEVFFNRPMNKAVAPQISFGVRDPWTQNAVNENGSWNDEGTIYTAYKTITGKTSSDGLNRIYVRGAEDNEFFPCPYEKTRFNINIQAAGSMATGFAAEASLGRVNLTWDNSNNDIEDAMGYNLYRFCREEGTDTIRINDEILGIETSEYIDYNIVPNHTYYYWYKVLSTDLREYDVSNVVVATPLTAMLGDANGSGDINVLDVVITVDYAMGKKPNPFVFDAADMNADKNIDVLDVIGIVQKILYPNGTSSASAVEAIQAIYTVEDGILYVESPVTLAGVQVQLALDGRSKMEEIRVAEDLKGFEQTSTWLTDEDYLFLAYSMNGKILAPGKHAILYIGDGELSTLRLADASGHNINVVPGQGVTKVDAMGSRVQRQEGIYDLYGRKIVDGKSSNRKLPHGVYIINGQKVVK